jgi:putative flippase GtrA
MHTSRVNSINRRFAYNYLFVGIWNTFFALILFIFLYEMFSSLHIQIILLASFIVTNFQSHLTQRKFVWKTRTKYTKELIRFYASSSVFYAMNVSILEIATRYTSLGIVQIQTLATSAILVISILVQKLFIFR